MSGVTTSTLCSLLDCKTVEASTSYTKLVPAQGSHRRLQLSIDQPRLTPSGARYLTTAAVRAVAHDDCARVAAGAAEMRPRWVSRFLLPDSKGACIASKLRWTPSVKCARCTTSLRPNTVINRQRRERHANHEQLILTLPQTESSSFAPARSCFECVWDLLFHPNRKVLDRSLGAKGYYSSRQLKNRCFPVREHGHAQSRLHM